MPFPHIQSNLSRTNEVVRVRKIPNVFGCSHVVQLRRLCSAAEIRGETLLPATWSTVNRTCRRTFPPRYFSVPCGWTSIRCSPEIAGWALVYSDADVPIASVYLVGTRLGPQAAFDPGVQSTVASGLNAVGMAVDGFGNVYVASSAASGGSNGVVRVPTGRFGYPPRRTLPECCSMKRSSRHPAMRRT